MLNVSMYLLEAIPKSFEAWARGVELAGTYPVSEKTREHAKVTCQISCWRRSDKYWQVPRYRTIRYPQVVSDRRRLEQGT